MHILPYMVYDILSYINIMRYIYIIIYMEINFKGINNDYLGI